MPNRNHIHYIHKASILKNGESINIFSPLFKALNNRNYLEATKILGSHPELVNVEESESNYSPLMFLCDGGSIAMINYLIEAGADLDHVSKKGLSVLFLALVHRNINMATILLQKGVNVNQPQAKYPPLLVAIKQNDLVLLDLLLQYKADVNARFMKGNQELSIFHYAARHGRLEIIKHLIEHGADWDDQVNPLGITPLHVAALAGKVAVVDFLLQLGADPNKPTKHGDYAIHMASKKGHLEVVKILVESGGKCNIKDSKGNLPIKYARYNKKKEMIRYFLSECKDVQCVIY